MQDASVDEPYAIKAGQVNLTAEQQSYAHSFREADRVACGIRSKYWVKVN